MKAWIEKSVHDLYWNKDINCAGTMLRTLAEGFQTELHPQTLQSAVGLHGAGGAGAQCGLVEGALIFISIYFGGMGQREQEIAGLCRQYAAAFEKRFQALRCCELRPGGFREDDPPHLCEQLTGEAIEFTYDFISEKASELRVLFESLNFQYYEEHAEDFIRDTENADMSELYSAFERLVRKGGHILDLGCGSGRDSCYFLQKGYQVTAVDGSLKLCHYAAEKIGRPVRHMRFEDLTYENEFDGIWACASLLHIGRDRLPELLGRLSGALRDGGILYASFKYGEGQHWENGRFYSDYTEEEIGELFGPEIGLRCLEWRLTEDVRGDRPSEYPAAGAPQAGALRQAPRDRARRQAWLNIWAEKARGGSGGLL